MKEKQAEELLENLLSEQVREPIAVPFSCPPIVLRFGIYTDCISVQRKTLSLGGSPSYIGVTFFKKTRNWLTAG
jgi:hypothetical protein